MKKQCSRCKKNKKLNKFHKHSTGQYGYHPTCKVCRKELGNSKINKIRRIYLKQKQTSRQRGNVPPSYTQQELIDWCMEQSLYHTLHDAWKESKYSTQLSPSCDRVDDYAPYTLDNLQLMTWGENKAKYHIDAKSGINNKKAKAVKQITSEGNVKNRYYSMHEAERKTGIPNGAISACCLGKQHSAGGFIWKFDN